MVGEGEGPRAHEENNVRVVEPAHDLYLFPEVSERLFIEVITEEPLDRDLYASTLASACPGF